MINALKKLLKIVFLTSLVVFGVTYFLQHKYPNSETISSQTKIDPIQTETDLLPFSITSENTQYTLTPLYTYELNGLIVTDYDAQNPLDFMHKRSNDSINTNDICVIWGENLSDNLHMRSSFKHGEFTCYYQVDNYVDYQKLKPSQLSNNHLIPANEEVHKRIDNATPGDEINLKGYLVKYKWSNDEGQSLERDTSTSRDDTGNGACEVIYVTDYQIIKANNQLAKTIHSDSLYVAAASLTVILALEFYKYYSM